MIVLALGAAAAVWIIVSPNRTAFLLAFAVGTNASAVIHEQFGAPPFILPLALATVAVGALRLLRRLPNVTYPASALPFAALAAVLAIVTSISLGPFVSTGAVASRAAVDRVSQLVLVLLAAATVAARPSGLRAALVGFSAAGATLGAATVAQWASGAYSATALGFSAWNEETIGGAGLTYRAVGPFGDDPNAYAQYLTVMLAAGLGLATVRWRRWNAARRLAASAGLTVMALALVATASRGGMIALVVVGIACLVMMRVDIRRLAYVAGTAAAALALLGPLGVTDRLASLGTDPTSAEADRGLQGRASEMLAAIDMFVDHPVTGVGYGSYNSRYLDYSRAVGLDDRFEERSAHSLPLEIAAEQGIIGLLATLMFVCSAIVVVRRLRRRHPDLGTALGLALIGFSSTALFLHDVHPTLLWTLMGLTLGSAFVASRPAPRADDPVRVAMVIQSYVPAVGGAERQLANLMPHLVAGGIEPIVVSRSMPGRPRDDEVDGVPVVRLLTVGPKLVRSLMFVVQARAVLARFDPDVVHAFDSLTPTSIALGHKGATGTPVVTKLLRSGELGDLHRLLVKPLGTIRRRRLVHRADAIVAISHDLVGELAEVGVRADRVAYIPNGVDADRFAPVRAHTGKGTRRSLTVLATGRLAPEKRLVELAARWHRVQARHPGAQLVLVGEGPDADRLATYEGVRLLGRRDDVPDLLRSADVYVSASSAEGLSNSLLEALASGVPVVVTDVGGVRDVIVRANQGAVVDPDDLDAFTDELIALLGDRRRRRTMRREGRRRVMNRFALTRTADELIALYRRLAGRSAGGHPAGTAADGNEPATVGTGGRDR